MQCRLASMGEAERNKAIAMGNTDLDKLFELDDLDKGEISRWKAEGLSDEQLREVVIAFNVQTTLV